MITDPVMWAINTDNRTLTGNGNFFKMIYDSPDIRPIHAAPSVTIGLIVYPTKTHPIKSATTPVIIPAIGPNAKDDNTIGKFSKENLSTFPPGIARNFPHMMLIADKSAIETSTFKLYKFLNESIKSLLL